MRLRGSGYTNPRYPTRPKDIHLENLENRLCLGPRVVSPHPQGLQGSHLNLSQTSAKRDTTYFLLNNKVCEPGLAPQPLTGQRTAPYEVFSSQ